MVRELGHSICGLRDYLSFEVLRFICIGESSRSFGRVLFDIASLGRV